MTRQAAFRIVSSADLSRPTEPSKSKRMGNDLKLIVGSRIPFGFGSAGELGLRVSR